jgi:hypothetical protein
MSDDRHYLRCTIVIRDWEPPLCNKMTPSEFRALMALRKKANAGWRAKLHTAKRSQNLG